LAARVVAAGAGDGAGDGGTAFAAAAFPGLPAAAGVVFFLDMAGMCDCVNDINSLHIFNGPAYHSPFEVPTTTLGAPFDVTMSRSTRMSTEVMNPASLVPNVHGTMAVLASLLHHRGPAT
jgi:hypothetical protein